MATKERIQALCKERKIFAKDLEIELELGKGYISKIDKNKPNMGNIQKIAKYFNVSTDYLMNGGSEENVLNAMINVRIATDPELIENIKKYLLLNVEEKEAVDKMINVFVDTREKK